MREEIVKLLERENKLSDDALSEIKNIEIDDFSNIVKEVGNEETDYIKKSEIQKDLNTQYIGKELYVFKEVASTNTVAKFLSMHNVANGTVVISEKTDTSKRQIRKIMGITIGRSLVINYIKTKCGPVQIPDDYSGHRSGSGKNS